METSSFHQLSLSKVGLQSLHGLRTCAAIITTSSYTSLWCRNLRLKARLYDCQIHHAVSKNVVFGITYQREIIVWRYNHFSTHRLLRGHIDWVESMVIATRRPAKDRLFAAPAAQASRGSRTTLKDRLAQQRREADLIRKKSSNLLKQKLSSVAADNPALAAILAASSQRPSTSGGTTAQNSNTVTPRRSTSAQGPRSAELKQDLSTESRSGQVTGSRDTLQGVAVVAK